jgi:two-component system chemotaxis response regulator CheB
MTAANIIVIGGSAGSLEMLIRIISELTNPSVAVMIVLHRNNKNESTLRDILVTKTDFAGKEAEDKETLSAKTIYIAPADYHLLIEKNSTLSLDASEKVNYSRPSIDVTFQSAAIAYPKSLACILLSGANADGVEALGFAQEQGCYIAVQDPSTASMPYMPQEAIKQVAVDLIIRPDAIRAALEKIDEFFLRR